MEEESPDPPFQHTYKALLNDGGKKYENAHVPIEEQDLLVIDLSRLDDGVEREECKREIAKASREWGFFQVVNHGISREILEEMRREQVKVFKMAFREKVSAELLAGSYRWGTPSANCLSQLSWSEAFHVPLADISGLRGLASLSSARTLNANCRVTRQTVARRMPGHTGCWSMSRHLTQLYS
ncbi:gibberellin 2-oxidase 8 [Actinidia rufa]|uniref:Gibberellin 2-oxidase 8 n=1 Tax=Actinidia rufa TaxID=165716 RepID=A0A7J0FX83_9ERIC|nr:gibberellin 2-oxidase 8 [Actinidia rufa]